MRPIARTIAAVGLVLVVSSPALAQRGRNVYTDEGVGTRDALVRVRELSEAGNMPEALRVLQKTLEAEGDQVISMPQDRDVFIPVRRAIMLLLMSDPELLRRYRVDQDAAGKKLLEQGRYAELEQSRLLTAPGMEAALRLAQTELDGARFESARLMLEQLEKHPDRVKGSAGAQRAARLAGLIASYAGRDEVRAWAERWATEAGIEGAGIVPARSTPPPAAAVMKSVSSMDPQRAPDMSSVPSQPLQSVGLEGEISDPDQGDAGEQRGLRRGPQAWVMPLLRNEVVYVNDGRQISAWDAATLGELWRFSPARAGSDGLRGADEFVPYYGQPITTGADDTTSVSVGSGIVVAATGVPEARGRRGDGRVHAIEAATGRVLWSLDVSWLSPKLAASSTSPAASVQGPVVIEGDTVVISAHKIGAQREIALYMIGVNLYTGGLRWVHLVGTMQNMMWYGQGGSRPDGPVIHNGVVYRGDKVGVLAAYEVATGRPLWVRTCPSNKFLDRESFRSPELVPPKEMCVPVIDGDSLFFVEYPKGRVVQVSLSDGKLLAKRDGSVLGDPRYLLKAGEYLACVGEGRICFVKLAELENGTPTLCTAGGKSLFSGRVTVAGDKVLAPVADGASLIDPKRPSEENQEHVEFACSGNLLVAGGDRPHLLSADDRMRLNTFLRWDEAKGILDLRVAAHPREAQPLLTYIELASRTGRAELVPDLADRVLTLLDADSGSEASVQGRARLYGLLMELTRGSRITWAETAPKLGVGVAQPIKDLVLLDKVMDRLGRAAESAPQRAAMLLERAWVREKQSNAPGAIEAYEQVLTDSSLGEVELDAGSRLGTGQGSSFGLARTEATNRLVALVKQVGPAPYAAFDDEAARLLADLGTSNGDKLAELARAYPVAAVTPQAWNQASAAYAQAGNGVEARLAAGSGLMAAELGASVGRTISGETIGKLTSNLLARSSGPTEIEPVYRLMRRLGRQSPNLHLDWQGGSATPGQVADQLHVKLAERSGVPIIGPALLHSVQVIESWEPMEALVRNVPGVSGDCVPMIDENSKQVGLWGVGAEDGRLHTLWTKPYQTRPLVIKVTPDSTLLFWPSPTGGVVEALATSDGSSQWKTTEFATLFGDGDQRVQRDPAERDNTPLGPVRLSDLVVTADGKTLVLVQRRGRAGAFDLGDGHALWHQSLEFNRVYDIELAGDCVVIAGAGLTKQGARSGAGLIALDKRTGDERSRLDAAVLGDHARWMRAVGADMVVATANGLVRYTPQTGNVVWKATGTPGATSYQGWVVNDGLFVLDGDVNLWYVSLADGSHASRPLDGRGRVVFPVNGVVMGNTLSITSSAGLVVYGDKGELVGSDGLEGEGNVQTPMIAQGLFVAVENNQHEEGADQGMVSRVFMFAHPTGKLLNTERVRLFESPHASMIIDGKVLLSEGPVTLVLDAPARP